MTRVARLYRFRASHAAEGLPEPWCSKHSHDYTVIVVAEGEGPIVVDTDEMDEVWETLRPRCARQHLHDSIGGPTTVEALAEFFLHHFCHKVSEVREVTVWEDQDRWGQASP